ncbi:MAG: alpha/beta hydrolase [Promethearchaeota archaeon]
MEQSKIRPEILKLVETRQKIESLATQEFLKLEENKGVNLKAYLQKVAKGNELYHQIACNKSENIEELHKILSYEDMLFLARYFRFISNYTANMTLERHPVPESINVEEIDAGGVAAEWQIIPEAKNDRVLLYFHGGAMIVMSPKTHRLLTIEIAKLTKMRVLSVDYRLAPEHPHPAPLEDCVKAYHWLLSKGYKPENIIIAGDSAGGSLTLTTLLKVRDEGSPLPLGAVTMSPHTDHTTLSRTIYENVKSDPLLSNSGHFWFSQAFLAGADPKEPLASPLFADLKGLPPLLVQVSTSEMLYDHSTRFVEKANAAGVNVTLQEWDGMVHVFQGYGLNILPEAREALNKIGEFIQSLFNKI